MTIDSTETGLTFSASPIEEPEVLLERTLHEFRCAIAELREIYESMDPPSRRGGRRRR